MPYLNIRNIYIWCVFKVLKITTPINNTCVLALSHLVSFLTHIEVNIWVWFMVFNATFNHISVIL